MIKIVRFKLGSKTSMPVIAAVASQGLRMITSLIIVKLMAVYTGPAGMGTIGHFMSLTTMLSVFAGGGIGNGVSKYVAEYRRKPRRMIEFLGSAAVYGITFSALIIFASILYRESISLSVFGSIDYSWLIPFLGFGQLLCFIGTFVVAVVNGLGLSRIYLYISIVGYLLVIPVAALLITRFGINGAAIAFVVVIGATSLPSILLLIRSNLVRRVRFYIVGDDTKKLFGYTLMLSASAISFPLAEIFIRQQIIDSIGIDNAGQWQAMTRLSGAYLSFFSVYLATVYMPRLSGIMDRHIIYSATLRMLIYIGIAFMMLAIFLNTFQDHVIKMLFSDQFYGMKELFGWYLIGDLFRILSYVIGFIAVAKAAVGIYMVGEAVQSYSYAWLAKEALLSGGGLQDVASMYAVTYIMYFLLAFVGLIIYRRISL